MCSVLRVLGQLPGAHPALLHHLLRLWHSLQSQGSTVSTTAHDPALHGALGLLCLPKACGTHGQMGLTKKVRGPLSWVPWGQSSHLEPLLVVFIRKDQCSEVHTWAPSLCSSRVI